MDANWPEISEACGLQMAGDTARPQSGGSISSAWRVESAQGPVFVKLEARERADRLHAEADGLAGLREVRAIRVPQTLATGMTRSLACLVLEWIEPGYGSAAAKQLGEGLARQHQVNGEAFGWRRDNYLGRTPQLNENSDDWVAFFREHRLVYQYELALSKGFRLNEIRLRRVADGLGAFYCDYQPSASLLHGDLWGGNWIADQEGRPVIFDPAVYFGDREADLAMSELFGGFSPDFYAGYDDAWPLDPGYPVRRDLHQLYHVLNHVNLFGAGYLGQASELLDRLSSELG